MLDIATLRRMLEMADDLMAAEPANPDDAHNPDVPHLTALLRNRARVEAQGLIDRLDKLMLPWQTDIEIRHCSIEVKTMADEFSAIIHRTKTALAKIRDSKTL